MANTTNKSTPKKNTTAAKSTRSTTAKKTATAPKKPPQKRKKRMTKAEKEALMKKQKIYYEIKMLALVAFTIFTLMTLFTNVTGIVGVFFKELYLGLFSFMGFLLPFFIFGYFFINLNPNFETARKRINIALTLFLVTGTLISTLLAYSGVGVEKLALRTPLLTMDALKMSYAGGSQILDGGQTGGIIGDLLTAGLLKTIGIKGTYLLIIVMGLVGFIIWTQMSLQDIYEEKRQKVLAKKQERDKMREMMTEELTEEEKKAPRKGVLPEEDSPEFLEKLDAYKQATRRKNIKDYDYDSYESDMLEKKEHPRVVSEVEAVLNPNSTEQAYHQSTPKQAKAVESTKEVADDSTQESSILKEESSTPPLAPSQVAHKEGTSKAIDKESTPSQEKPQKIKDSDIDPQTKQAVNDEIRQQSEKKIDHYQLPPLSILQSPKAAVQSGDQSEYMEKAKLLEETLNNFNVDAKVVSVKRGPSITMYEVQLSPGIKVSKVVGLSEDIALNLATSNVRIAPIPGKAAIGIEVPNKSTSMVTIREVIDSKTFREQKSKLAIGLGKDISGNPIIGDLATMPHLLIAGATGSGKSVCVNTIISSILFHSTPDEVKFLMIDPKVVELSNYNGIPHLILPVVTDPKKASIALNWAVNEMTRRYKLFAETSVRDMKGYNRKNKTINDGKADGEKLEEILPQIVIIIDELADLMMVAPNQVEDAICRLAQMARAAGIHLIVATQRPSVDVITGLIKANIPSRIAFSVSSSVDSRTIIDMGGAEKLLGKGDMLYYPVGAPKPRRAQGAFMSDEEVENVVEYIKSQTEEVHYNETILEEVPSADNHFDDADEYLEDAIKLALETGHASASMMQRKFRVGYNRAARLIDAMEERGLVGPSRGSKPREVLMTLQEFEMQFNNDQTTVDEEIPSEESAPITGGDDFDTSVNHQPVDEGEQMAIKELPLENENTRQE